MKTVCVVTTARSEYGLLRWVIDAVKHSSHLQLRLIVAGSHLIAEQGFTYKEIEKDGYHIDKKVEFLLSTSTVVGIAKSMGIYSISIAEVLNELLPDLLVILGDRYELLPICNCAVVMNIPLAHISGGDITKGAIDNQVRNAVTMMSTYHFPGTVESAQRIKMMLGKDEHVYVVGETNLDNFVKMDKMDRAELADSLNLDENKKWILCTYHSETKLSLDDNMIRISDLVLFLSDFLPSNYEILITASNADFGGTQINSYFSSVTKQYSNFHFVTSLGQLRYVSILSQLFFMIGNSSSGIFEAPIAKVPVINIGNRQQGRFIAKNIINADGSLISLKEAYNRINELVSTEELEDIPTPYGDGFASERIVSLIENILYEND